MDLGGRRITQPGEPGANDDLWTAWAVKLWQRSLGTYSINTGGASICCRPQLRLGWMFGPWRQASATNAQMIPATAAAAMSTPAKNPQMLWFDRVSRSERHPVDPAPIWERRRIGYFSESEDRPRLE